jgi:hypothetical protein
MATLTVTVAAGGEAGNVYRRLARQIEKATSAMPDQVSSGASSTLTITDSPLGVQVTAGPYQSASFKV